MQEGRKVPGEGQTIKMGQRLRQGQRLLTPPHGLRRIAQTPQRPSHNGKAPHPRQHVMAERLGSLRHWVREDDPLLEVRPSGGVIAQIK